MEAPWSCGSVCVCVWVASRRRGSRGQWGGRCKLWVAGERASPTRRQRREHLRAGCRAKGGRYHRSAWQMAEPLSTALERC
jgi:hypothetical protein